MIRELQPDTDESTPVVPGVLLVGLNHRTAPVELRERLSLTASDRLLLADNLRSLKTESRDSRRGDGEEADDPVIQECVILSTCNRFEIYVVARDTDLARIAIENSLTQIDRVLPAQLLANLYVHEGPSVVVHLLRVVSGLDSMIVGEPQIQGQVGAAFREARAAGATGPILSHLFDRAAHAGKRARTETAISCHTGSVSHAAAMLVESVLGPLAELRGLVVGAGEMAQLAAEALLQRGLKEIAFINRTYDAAADLARQYQGKAVDWYHLSEALQWADAVVTATRAPHTVIHVDDVERIDESRGTRALLFVDIAVPRDVDEAVGWLEGVILHDIDELQTTLDQNLSQRRRCIPLVEAILGEEVEEFLEWLHGRRVVPVIVEMRRRAQSLARKEARISLQRMHAIDDHDREIVQRLVYRVVNKVLHEATMNLKSYSCSPNSHRCAMRRYVRTLEQVVERKRAGQGSCTHADCDSGGESGTAAGDDLLVDQGGQQREPAQ